ncbi:MAG: ParB/RepB/Spo0J family partition protein, partial [Candidatus Aminicenantaceae bacterium]
MQKSKKTGLPGSVNMRHDGHFVDLIATRVDGPRIRMVPIEKIDPNPQQARSELGDLKELMASIEQKGILEPIIVRPRHGRYEIIAGERRYVASKRLGLKEIPCIEKHVEDNEAMEIALIENLQRKNLDAFEEADGLHALAEMYGYSHQDISKKIGKARSTITEVINLSKIPKDIRKLCHENNITSRTTLLEIAKLKDKEHMTELIRIIQERDLKREDTRDLSKRMMGKLKRPRMFVYNYKPAGSEYRMRLEFKNQDISKDDIIMILEEIIKNL